MGAGRGARAMAVALALLGLGAFGVSARESWQPVRPISVIVPWPAGGASDSVARMIAGLMGPLLGQRMAFINVPGGAGAIGTQETWDRAHDGYTLTANSTVSIGSYPILGKLEQTHRDWRYYLPIFAPNVICVRSDSPIRNVDDLVALMKAKPGRVLLSSAGVGSSGYFGAEVFRAATGVEFRHVPFAGGVSAVMAVASGEADVVMQLSVEVAGPLRSGRLRALATTARAPLAIEGYGEIPSIRKWIPSFPDYGSYFGLIAPADLPRGIVAAYDRAFVEAAASPAVKDYARREGAVAVAIHGQEAAERVERLVGREAWILFDSGVAARSPADFGIAR